LHSLTPYSDLYTTLEINFMVGHCIPHETRSKQKITTTQTFSDNRIYTINGNFHNGPNFLYTELSVNQNLILKQDDILW
jgi:hypothetical protein